MEEVFDTHAFSECEVMFLPKREQVTHGPPPSFVLNVGYGGPSCLMEESFHVGLDRNAAGPGPGS